MKPSVLLGYGVLIFSLLHVGNIFCDKRIDLHNEKPQSLQLSKEETVMFIKSCPGINAFKKNQDGKKGKL